MATIQIEVPEKLAEGISNLVKMGWFLSEGELARQALTEFIQRFQPELLSQYSSSLDDSAQPRPLAAAPASPPLR